MAAPTYSRTILTRDPSGQYKPLDIWHDGANIDDFTETLGPALATQAQVAALILPKAAAMPNAVPPGALTTILQLLGAHNALVASHNTLLARLRAAGLMET